MPAYAKGKRHILTFLESGYRLRGAIPLQIGRCFKRDTAFHNCYNNFAVAFPPENDMPIISSASVQDLKRLLDLYPVSSLREHWPDLKGTKDQMCLEIAGRRKEILPFLSDYLGCCKQHVYVYSHSMKLSALVPPVIPDGELLEVKNAGGRVQMLYLVRVEFRVVLRDPLEEDTVEFLWPVHLDFTGKYLIARFVVLEKNVGTYIIGRSAYTTSRSVDENGILTILERSFSGALRSTDLQKGVKKLWDADFMDATRAQFKKTDSVATEVMDEKRLIN